MSAKNRKPPGRFGPIWTKVLVSWLPKWHWDATVIGAEHVPKSGPAIYVSNHVGFIDGPVLHGVAPRAAHFLVKESMFKKALGVLLRAGGMIIVEGNGRSALARGLAVLKRKRVVGVFPEGTRGSGDASNIHGGAAWLAVHSGAPVVPVALFGTRLTGEKVSVWPKRGRKMMVAFGTPFDIENPDHLRGSKLQAYAQESVATALQDHIAASALLTDIALPQDDAFQDTRQQEAVNS